MLPVEITPIPLIGPGVVSRNSEHYLEGEYKELVNVVMTDEGSLIKRPQAVGLMHPASKRLDRIIGYRKHQAVFSAFNPTTGGCNLYFSTDSNIIEKTPAGSLHSNIDASASFESPFVPYVNHSYLIEGFFTYGGKDFTIISHVGYEDSLGAGSIHAGEVQFHIGYKTNDIPEVTTASSYVNDWNISPALPVFWDNTGTRRKVNSVQWDLTAGNAFVDSGSYNNQTSSTHTVDLPISPLSGFFMHKDRLVISVYDTVYLSKAGDPTKFGASDDGAFFRFPGKNISAIVALLDNIYVIFEDSVSVITYNNGPNLDAEVRVISESAGGNDAVVYGDTIYLINSKTVYSINGFNITKALDILSFIPEKGDTHRLSGDFEGISGFLKLGVFKDFLYIISGHKQFVSRTASTATFNHPHAIRHISENSRLTVISLKDGHVSNFSYEGVSSLPETERYNVADMIFVPVEDKLSQSKLVLMGLRDTDFTPSVFVHGFNAIGTYDSFSTSNGSSMNLVPIKIRVWIPEFSPDQYEYFFKRLRTLLLEANVPMWCNSDFSLESELELLVTVGPALSVPNFSASPLKVDLTAPPIVNGYSGTPHHGDIKGYRFGLNQRAKAMGLYLRTKGSLGLKFTPMSALTSPLSETMRAATAMEITDISVAWTPTQRGPGNRPNSRS